MAQKYTEARKEGNRKWDAANLDRLSLALPKGSRETIKAHATAHNESVNGFIGRAISETMERDGGETASEIAGKRPELTARAGVVSLSSETLEAAQRAADAAGEELPQFVARAVETQAQRDKSSLQMGLNPITGDKLEKAA